eukprot:CAMPEP_0178370920 /NCGR_PEP_ID=MMETSP0689_2-20121128/555_1 /TAXON_ID=160604 /ORGANISM="Amphidinium massartii, Strain CS-259" /LENGTH=857 /DNA_ID=CAMNT_0019990765 /DNA_START=26 /DNA_END=2600 /DNA_ORIENTATION=-
MEGSADSAPVLMDPSAYESMSTRQLRKECTSRGIDLSQCFDRMTMLGKLQATVAAERHLLASTSRTESSKDDDPVHRTVEANAPSAEVRQPPVQADTMADEARFRAPGEEADPAPVPSLEEILAKLDEDEEASEGETAEAAEQFDKEGAQDEQAPRRLQETVAQEQFGQPQPPPEHLSRPEESDEQSLTVPSLAELLAQLDADAEAEADEDLNVTEERSISPNPAASSAEDPEVWRSRSPEPENALAAEGSTQQEWPQAETPAAEDAARIGTSEWKKPDDYPRPFMPQPSEDDTAVPSLEDLLAQLDEEEREEASEEQEQEEARQPPAAEEARQPPAATEARRPLATEEAQRPSATFSAAGADSETAREATSFAGRPQAFTPTSPAEAMPTHHRSSQEEPHPHREGYRDAPQADLSKDEIEKLSLKDLIRMCHNKNVDMSSAMDSFRNSLVLLLRHPGPSSHRGEARQSMAEWTDEELDECFNTRRPAHAKEDRAFAQAEQAPSEVTSTASTADTVKPMSRLEEAVHAATREAAPDADDRQRATGSGGAPPNGVTQNISGSAPPLSPDRPQPTPASTSPWASMSTKELVQSARELGYAEEFRRGMEKNDLIELLQSHKGQKARQQQTKPKSRPAAKPNIAPLNQMPPPNPTSSSTAPRAGPGSMPQPSVKKAAPKPGPKRGMNSSPAGVAWNHVSYTCGAGPPGPQGRASGWDASPSAHYDWSARIRDLFDRHPGFTAYLPPEAETWPLEHLEIYFGSNGEIWPCAGKRPKWWTERDSYQQAHAQVPPKEKHYPDLEPHFKTLDLAPTTPHDVIKRHYKRLVLEAHPDKHPEDVEGATASFRKLQEAYEAIRDRLRL